VPFNPVVIAYVVSMKLKHNYDVDDALVKKVTASSGQKTNIFRQWYGKYGSLLIEIGVIGIISVALYLFMARQNPIGIGGDTFGNIAEFMRNKQGITPLNACDCLQNTSKELPNPIDVGIKSVISTISETPTDYINSYFVLFLLGAFIPSYLAIRRFTIAASWSPLLAFFGGISIAFSSFNLMHFFAGHFSHTLIFFLFLAGALGGLLVKQSWPRALTVGVVHGIGTLYNPYFGYFAGLMYLVIAAYYFFYRREEFRQVCTRLLVASVVAITVLVVVYGQHIQTIIGAHEQTTETRFNRSLATLGGVMPYMYVLPSSLHWMASEGYAQWVSRAIVITNVPESAVYLGAVNMILFALGVWFLWKKKFNAREIFWFRLTLFGAIAAFILSLPPFIPLGGERRIYWVNYYLHELLPMFRMYGRMGVVVLLFVTTGSVIVLSHWLRMLRTRGRVYLATAVCLGLIIDLTPTLPTLELERRPAVYDWLAAQPGEFAIYEIPEHIPHGEKDLFQLYKQLYYQTFHKKRVANRGITHVAWEQREFMDELKRQDVRFIIEHLPRYAEGPIPKEYKLFVHPKVAVENYGSPDRALPAWYQLVFVTKDVRVYKII